MDMKEFFPMTSRELEYIKTVADEKSISAAARKLYIAQPSLSQSLQRIEENLDAHLFQPDAFRTDPYLCWKTLLSDGLSGS